MKYLSTKYLNKIGKTALVMVLAGTYAFSNPISLAAEEIDPSKDYEVVEMPSSLTAEETADEDITKEMNGETTQADDAAAEKPESIVEDKTEGTETAEEAADTDESAVEEDAEIPSLVPGDLFYFVKIAFEKIQLAFTVDDVKEAKLLAKFSAERLAEAEALFAEGNDDEALETIKKALEYLEGSEGQLSEEETEETDSDGQGVVEEDKATSEEDGTADDDNTAVEDENAEGEETADNTDKEGTEEVKQLISQNIIALTAAMEKVKNPTAKAALKKNIEKSYAKLEKKAAKMAAKEERKARKAEKRAAEEDEATVDNNTAAGSQTPAVNNTETKTAPATEAEKAIDTTVPAAEAPATIAEKTETPEPVTPTPAPSTVVTEQKPVVQEPVNHSRAQVKAEAKQIKENAKQEAKAARTEAKQEAKAIRNEAKQEAKEIRNEAKQEAKQKRDEMKQNHQQDENKDQNENKNK